MDYFSFEDVMAELELGEEELKRMVSEGELRAFRDENKMKFKKEDVESLKKGRITEPTIILPSTPVTETQDETVLDLDIGQETAALSDTSAQLAAVGGGQKPKGGPAETDDDLVVQAEEVGAESEETFIEEDTDTGLSTEPLKLADETADETVEAEAVEEEVAAPPPVARRRTGMTGVARKVGSKIPVAVEEEIERKRAHPVWTFFVFLAFVVSLYSGFFVYDAMAMDMGKTDQPSAMTKGLSRWILDKFWQDAKWRNFHQKKYPDGGTKVPPFTDPYMAGKQLNQNYETITFDKPQGKGIDAAAPGAAPAPNPQ